MKLKIKTPVKIVPGGEMISEFILRDEMNAGDLKGLRVTELTDPTPEQLGKVMARLSGRTDFQLLLNQMTPGDYLKVVEAYILFLGLGQDSEQTTPMISDGLTTPLQP